MSYIPNVREKKVSTPFTKKGEETENAYYEGNIRYPQHNSFKEGFDYAIETMLSLFDNLEVYEEEFERIKLSTKPQQIDIYSEYINGNNTYEHDMAEATDLSYTAFSQLPKNIQTFATFKEVLNHWMEMSRNEMIVGLIETEMDIE